jgi:terminal uridylyltransferase
MFFQQSLADLWIGFLEYYASSFSEKTQVISVRQKSPVIKFEKMWTSKCFAIEDPFDLNHNLGAGLSRKSNLLLLFY